MKNSISIESAYRNQMTLTDEEAEHILKRRAKRFGSKEVTCTWCKEVIRFNFNNSIITYKYCPVCGEPLKGAK